MIYENLIAGHEKFGTSISDICISVLHCSPEEIHENVIVAPWWRPYFFEAFGGEIIPVYEGLDKQVWTVNLPDVTLSYIRTGIGSPLVGDTALALGCTPCKRIIFIGSAGALHDDLSIGDLVIPEYSMSGDGVCRYLTGGRLSDNNHFGEKYYPNDQFNQKVLSAAEDICLKSETGFHKGTNFSIDTIFAQFAHLDEIIDYGCNTIEMESAALFRSAEITGIEAAAIFSISDNSVKNKSLYSGRSDGDHEYRRRIRNEIIPQIIIESLK